jgi:hypothetical protein
MYFEIIGEITNIDSTFAAELIWKKRDKKGAK